MLKPGGAWYTYKEQIEDALDCFALSKEFGWTPEYIRKMEQTDKMAYIALLAGTKDGGN